MEIEAPRAIGPYVVESMLGTGAFSAVYKVLEPAAERTLALKLLSPAEGDARERRLRFQREVEIASKLEHPNLVRVLGWGEHDGRPYCTMELVEGPSLRQVIASRLAGPSPKAWRERVDRLGSPLFSALQYIHNHHIVHRDLKPENVLVDGNDSPRLADFGLAVWTRSLSMRSMAGTLAGTIAYMAPELFSGVDADRRSDIYSLGIVLLELIGGRLPYPIEDVAPLLNVILTDGPMPLHELDSSSPPALDKVLRRMTSRHPEDRYFTISEAYQDWAKAIAAWSELPQPAAALTVEGACDLFEPAFVGRQAELSKLQSALASAAAGRPQVVVLGGEPGIGKSRLLGQFLRTLGADPRLLFSTCALGQEVPYQAFAALEELQGLLDTEAQTASTATGSVHDVSRGDRVRLHESVRRQLMQACQARTVVLAIDNVQWMDASSLELLEYLMQRWWLVPGTLSRCLVVLGLRPEEMTTGWLAALPDRIQRCDLGLMSDRELESLACSALGSRQLPQPLSRVLRSESGGNPFVLIEVLNALLKENVLQLAATTWLWNEAAYAQWTLGLVQGEASTSLDRVRQMIVRRLSWLSDIDRELLAVCAAGNGGFSFEEVLETVCSLEGESVTERRPIERRVLDSLDRLVASHVLRETRDRHLVRYSFVNQKVQQIAIATLSQARRLHLHRAWARVLETMLAGEDTQEGHALLRAQRVFRLLDHLEQTGEWAAAGRLVARAAEIAAASHAHRLAWQLYTRLVDAHRSSRFLSAEELRQIILRTADLASLAGEHQAALTLLEPQLDLAPDAATRIRIIRMMARTCFDGGDFVRALSLWKQVLDLMGIPLPASGKAGWGRVLRAFASSAHKKLIPPVLRQPEHAEPIMEICEGIAAAGYFLGILEPVIPYAIALTMQAAQATQRPEWMAHACMVYSLMFVTRTPPQQGLFKRFATAAEKHAEKAGQTKVLVKVLRNLSYGACMTGDPRTSRMLAKRAAALAREVYDMTGLAWVLVVGAFAQRFLGDLQGAEEELLEGRDLICSLQHRSLAVNVRLGLAHVYLLEGRLDLASDALNSPLDFEVMTPLNRFIEDLYRGIILLRKNDAGALDLLKTAFEDSERVRAGAVWILMAGHHYGLALAEAIRDKRSDAVAELRRVHGRCSRLAGNIPLLKLRVLWIQAELEDVSGNRDRSQQLYESCAELCTTESLMVDLAFVRERQALLLRARQAATWQSALRTAADLWEKVGAPWQQQYLLTKVDALSETRA